MARFKVLTFVLHSALQLGLPPMEQENVDPGSRATGGALIRGNDSQEGSKMCLSKHWAPLGAFQTAEKQFARCAECRQKQRGQADLRKRRQLAELQNAAPELEGRKLDLVAGFYGNPPTASCGDCFTTFRHSRTWADVELIALEDFCHQLHAIANRNRVLQYLVDLETINAFPQAELLAKHVRDQVFECTGFFFILRDTTALSGVGQKQIRYHCAQDSAFTRKSNKSSAAGVKNRDRLPMTRFDCKGQLDFRIDWEKKTMFARWHHHPHLHYLDVRTPEPVKQYIQRNLDQTSHQLFATSRLQLTSHCASCPRIKSINGGVVNLKTRSP